MWRCGSDEAVMEDDAKSKSSKSHFPSVREAVSVYGEKVVAKARKPNVVEKLAAVEEELKAAHDEIEKRNKELALSERRRQQAVEEGNEVKRIGSEVEKKLVAALVALQVSNSAKLEIQQQHEESLKECSALKVQLQSVKHENQDLTGKLEDCKVELAEIKQIVMDLTGSENAAEGLPRLKQLAYDTMQELADANGLMDCLARELEESRSDVLKLMDSEGQEEIIRSAHNHATRTLELASTDYTSLAGKIEKLKLETLTLNGELGEAKVIVNRTAIELQEARLAQTSQAEMHAHETRQLALELDTFRDNEKILREEILTLEEALMQASNEAEALRAALKEMEKSRLEAEQVKSSLENNAFKLNSIEKLFLDFKKSLEDKESSANKKISAAHGEASATRIREQHMLIRLDAMREELDEARMAASNESKKAEIAEAEKVAAVNELRRWKKASRLLNERNANITRI